MFESRAVSQKTRICLYILFAVLVFRGISKYWEYKRGRNLANSYQICMNRFFDFFSKNPQNDFYDLYLTNPATAYTFISEYRLFHDRKTAGIRKKTLAKAVEAERIMTSDEFNMVCDFKIFTDHAGNMYILDDFTKKLTKQTTEASTSSE